MKTQFTGQLKEYKTKSTVDLSKTTRLTIDTEQVIGSALDEIQADQVIRVTIETE